jgi:hypothetical protein
MIASWVAFKYYARLFQGMSLDEAKKVLGLPIGEVPSHSEIFSF